MNGSLDDKAPTQQEFAHWLGNIFSSDHGTGLDGSAGGSTETIPIFSLLELKTVVSSLKFGRCADVDGIVAEMFIYAGEDLLQCLLDIFNTMIMNNSFDTVWYRSTMLPKTGDSSKPSNWRPIAVLKITYKIFAMLLLNRLAPFLEHEHPADQLGFRRGLGIDDAMVVLENVCGKCLAWESDIWFASLDPQKAFDRIEHDSLFQAVQAQGVPDTYLQVLRRLYTGQSGIVHGSNCVFDITRGVKQGDVLSPMLFNSGLEHAMRNWKQSLKSHGLHVGAVDRLTNIRYADDLLLFAKSWKELVEIMELLVVELNRVGLQLNTSKTK